MSLLSKLCMYTLFNDLCVHNLYRLNVPFVNAQSSPLLFTKSLEDLQHSILDIQAQVNVDDDDGK